MSMSLGAVSGATHAAHAALLASFDAPEKAPDPVAVARPDAGAGPTAGEKMTDDVARHAAIDLVAAIEAKFLQVKIEAADIAALKAPDYGRPVGREDGPQALTEGRGMTRQIADQAQSAKLFEAQLMEIRTIAEGRAARLADLRA